MVFLLGQINSLRIVYIGIDMENMLFSKSIRKENLKHLRDMLILLLFHVI